MFVDSMSQVVFEYIVSVLSEDGFMHTHTLQLAS